MFYASLFIINSINRPDSLAISTIWLFIISPDSIITVPDLSVMVFVAFLPFRYCFCLSSNKTEAVVFSFFSELFFSSIWLVSSNLSFLFSICFSLITSSKSILKCLSSNKSTFFGSSSTTSHFSSSITSHFSSYIIPFCSKISSSSFLLLVSSASSLINSM